MTWLVPVLCAGGVSLLVLLIGFGLFAWALVAGAQRLEDPVDSSWDTEDDE